MSERKTLNGPQCLKHGSRWHTRFQQLMNILRDTVTKQIFYNIGDAICTCDPEDDEFRLLPERVQEKVKRRPKDPRWESFITDDVANETYQHFENYIESNYNQSSDDYRHLKDILKVLKDKGQLSHRLTSANRFLYIFYKLDKGADLNLLNLFDKKKSKSDVKVLEMLSDTSTFPPLEQNVENPLSEFYPSLERKRTNQKVESQPLLPKEKLVMHLKSLRPENMGNFIGKKGVHIKSFLRGVKKSKITLVKEKGHVKIEIEAGEKDIQYIKSRVLQYETLVCERRRRHEQNVRVWRVRDSKYNKSAEYSVQYKEDMTDLYERRCEANRHGLSHKTRSGENSSLKDGHCRNCLAKFITLKKPEPCKYHPGFIGQDKKWSCCNFDAENDQPTEKDHKSTGCFTNVHDWRHGKDEKKTKKALKHKTSLLDQK